MNRLLKVFLILLILQFILYNFITYVIGFENQFIWLWKEIFIIGITLYLIYNIIKSKKWKFIIEDKKIFYLQLLFIILVLGSFFITYFVKGISIGQFILAFKYDFFGFFIFFLFYNISYFLQPILIQDIIRFFGKILKILLVMSLLWYVIISIKPEFMHRFGYDPYVYEGEIGKKPPAAYYADMRTGTVRNQFIFERPITWGFFLVAFWPLFYILYLRKKTIKKTYGWRILYGINVFITFSRAAWGAWFAEIVILGFFVYGKNIKKYFMKLVVPLIIIGLLIIGLGFNHFVKRQFSDVGHVKLVIESVKMLFEDPLLGKGAGFVGPASHQVCVDNENEICKRILKVNQDMDSNLIGFNNENQYLQIAVEFGIPLTILWLIIYIFFNIIGIVVYKKTTDKNNIVVLALLALSIGMIGLSIEGLVLHNFVDRMIVYPMMCIMGLVYGAYIFSSKKQIKITQDFWKK